MGEMGNQRNRHLLMKNTALLLIFAKNITLGKVKTRLAKTEGETFALDVYKKLVAITEAESLKLKDTDVHVYFTEAIVDSPWKGKEKFIQSEGDLGVRMGTAFKHGFDNGYKRIIGIGTDLPDLNADIMTEALEILKSNDTVFGKAEDGGYYLIGMNQWIPQIFENKPWSTETLLDITLMELNELGYASSTLQTLNDIDTIDDLKASWLGEEFRV